MKQIFCTCCGSKNIEFKDNYFLCKNCKSIFSNDFSNENYYSDIIQADELRQTAQFSKAKSKYISILNNYPNIDLCDVYWGIFLCDNYIIFETDGKNQTFPSFFNISNTSIYQSKSYITAIDYAINHNDQKYNTFVSLAENIEKARKMYIDIKNTTEPFDIFICYKSTNYENNIFGDSVLANDIYNNFSNKYNIFLSEKTLSNIKSNYRDYEPNIYYGLYTAKVMLLICSKKAYLQNLWIKNEWNRFLKINSSSLTKEKIIIPIFTNNFSPNDLPEELWHKQGIFDDRNLINNLSTQLESIFPNKNLSNNLDLSSIQNNLSTNLNNDNFSITSTDFKNNVDAINKFLQAQNYNEALNLWQKLYLNYPNSFETYFLKIQIDNKVNSIIDLSKIPNITTTENFINAKIFAKNDYQKKLLENISSYQTKFSNEYILNLENAFSSGNFKEFSNAFLIYSKFEPNSFIYHYYNLFFKHNTTDISTLVSDRNIINDYDYLELLKNYDGYEVYIENLKSAYDNRFNTLLKNMQDKLKFSSFDEFLTAYNEFSIENRNSFEAIYYSFFAKNKVRNISDLAKVPNIITSKEWYDLLEKRKSEAHFNMLNELENEVKDYYNILTFDLKNAFDLKDKKLFTDCYEKAKNYLNNFEIFYYGIFYDNKTFDTTDLKNCPDLLSSNNFIKAKKYASTDKEIALIHSISSLYNTNYQNDINDIVYKFNKIDDFCNLMETYKLINVNFSSISKGDLKNLLFNRFCDLYLKKLSDIENILKNQQHSLLYFNQNYNDLLVLYDNTINDIKSIVNGKDGIIIFLKNNDFSINQNIISYEKSLNDLFKSYKKNIENLYYSLSSAKRKNQQKYKLLTNLSIISVSLFIVIISLILSKDYFISNFSILQNNTTLKENTLKTISIIFIITTILSFNLFALFFKPKIIPKSCIFILFNVFAISIILIKDIICKFNFIGCIYAFIYFVLFCIFNSLTKYPILIILLIMLIALLFIKFKLYFPYISCNKYIKLTKSLNSLNSQTCFYSLKYFEFVIIFFNLFFSLVSAFVIAFNSTYITTILLNFNNLFTLFFFK